MAALAGGAINTGLAMEAAKMDFEQKLIEVQKKFRDEEDPSKRRRLPEDAQRDAKKMKLREILNINPAERNMKRKLRIRELKSAVKHNALKMAGLSLGGIVVAYTENEVFYENGNVSTPLTVLLRFIVMFSSIAIIPLCYRHALNNFHIAIERKDIEAECKFSSTMGFKKMLLEMFINFVHTPPGIDQVIAVSQLDISFDISVNSCIAVFMIVRFYILLRLFGLFSKWTNEENEYICEAYGCEASTMFALKSELKERPLLLLTSLFLTSTLIFGFATRAFERPLNQVYADSPHEPLREKFQDYDSVWNCMWLIVLAMTTVGYGDFYPRSHPGRMVVVISCFWGVFLVSMMVVSMRIMTHFKASETKAFEILFRLRLGEGLRIRAARVIAKRIDIWSVQRKKDTRQIGLGQFVAEKLQEMTKYSRLKEEFQNYRAFLSKPVLSPEEMLRQMDLKVDLDLDIIKTQLTALKKLESFLRTIALRQQFYRGYVEEALKHTDDLKLKVIESSAEAQQLYRRFHGPLPVDSSTSSYLTRGRISDTGSRGRVSTGSRRQSDRSNVSNTNILDDNNPE